MKLNITIKKIRIQHGMSQKELGDKLGVSKQAISMYERGERTPDADMLCKLSDVFDIDINELLGRPIQQPSQTEKAPGNMPEAEDELIQLIRLMPEDMKKIYVDALRAALKAQGLIP